MRMQRFTKILVAATVAVTLCLAVGANAGAQGIAWQTDLNSATAEAKQSGKVIMVDVYTDWCELCKVPDTKTYTDAKAIAGAEQFVARKLNPEKSTSGAQFAKRYGVSGYPTILFVEWDGTLVSKVEGHREYMTGIPFFTVKGGQSDGDWIYLVMKDGGVPDKNANPEDVVAMTAEDAHKVWKEHVWNEDRDAIKENDKRINAKAKPGSTDPNAPVSLHGPVAGNSLLD